MARRTGLSKSTPGRIWRKFDLNQNPRPFAWARTTEEILDSLAKYIATISGAGH